MNTRDTSATLGFGRWVKAGIVGALYLSCQCFSTEAKTIRLSPSGSQAESCGADSEPCADLVSAIKVASSGDTITIDGSAQAYQCGSALAPVVTQSIRINGVTINNNIPIIQPCADGSVLSINSTTVTIAGVKFLQLADSAVKSILSLSNSSLSLDETTFEGSGSSSFIQAENSLLQISSCNFRRGGALSGSGGAISFSINKDESIAPISASGGALLSIKRSLFDSNSALAGGAALYVNVAASSLTAAPISITDSSFKYNSIDASKASLSSPSLGSSQEFAVGGSAIRISANLPTPLAVTLVNNIFEGNSVTGFSTRSAAGGAVLVEFLKAAGSQNATSQSPTLRVTQNKFTTNQVVLDASNQLGISATGGALAISYAGDKQNYTQSTASEDTAPSAIFTAVVEDNTFASNGVRHNNVALSDGCGGGAVHVYASGSQRISVSRNILDKNLVQLSCAGGESLSSAQMFPFIRGGSVAIEVETENAIDSDQSKSSAGGSSHSVTVDGNTVTFNQILLSSNVSAIVAGGGVSVKTAQSHLWQTDNSTIPTASAISPVVKITNNEFSNNAIVTPQSAASSAGGGLFVHAVGSGPDELLSSGKSLLGVVALQIRSNKVENNTIKQSYAGHVLYSKDLVASEKTPTASGAGIALRVVPTTHSSAVVEMSSNQILQNHIDASGSLLSVSGGGVSMAIQPLAKSTAANNSSSNNATAAKIALTLRSNTMSENAVKWVLNYPRANEMLLAPTTDDPYPSVRGGAVSLDVYPLLGETEVSLLIQQDKYTGNEVTGSMDDNNSILGMGAFGAGVSLLGSSVPSIPQGEANDTLPSSSVQAQILDSDIMENRISTSNSSVSVSELVAIDGNGGGVYSARTSLTLMRVKFTGNRAVKSGGGVHAVALNSPINSYYCTFDGNLADQRSASQLSVDSLGPVTIQHATLNYTASVGPKAQPVAADGGLLSTIVVSSAKFVSFNDRSLMACPAGFQAEVARGSREMQVAHSGSNAGYTPLQISRVNALCRACPSGFYSFQQGTVAVSDNSDIGGVSCYECPDGGDCSLGGSSISSAGLNMYGVIDRASGTIEFRDCPVGFCCTKAEDHQSCGLQECRGNRDGFMCSTCQQGYSAALFTSSCVESQSCGAGWDALTWGLFIGAYWLVIPVLCAFDRKGVIAFFLYFLQICSITLSPIPLDSIPGLEIMMSLITLQTSASRSAHGLCLFPGVRPALLGFQYVIIALCAVCSLVVAHGIHALVLYLVGKKQPEEEMVRVAGELPRKLAQRRPPRPTAAPLGIPNKLSATINGPPPPTGSQLQRNPSNSSLNANTQPQDTPAPLLLRAAMHALALAVVPLYSTILVLTDCRVNDEGVSVLFRDSSVQCSYPLKASAIVAMIFFSIIIAFPLLRMLQASLDSYHYPNGFLRYLIHRFRLSAPLGTITSSIGKAFRPSLSYWPTVLAFHRILIVFVSIFSAAITTSMLANGFLAVFFLMLHARTMPAVSSLANHVQAILLLQLVFITFLSLPFGPNGAIIGHSSMSESVRRAICSVIFCDFIFAFLYSLRMCLRLLPLSARLCRGRSRYGSEDSAESSISAGNRGRRQQDDYLECGSTSGEERLEEEDSNEANYRPINTSTCERPQEQPKEPEERALTERRSAQRQEEASL